MNRLPPASRLELAKHCRTPFYVSSVEPRPPAPWAEYGTLVSRLAEGCVTFSDADPVALVHALCTTIPADVAGRVREDLEGAARAILRFVREQCMTWARTEVPLAIDALTGLGRVLPSADPRDRTALKECEFWGIADLVYTRTILDENIYYVLDFKTGRYTHGIRPIKIEQLRMLGAAQKAQRRCTVYVQKATIDDGRMIVVSDVVTDLEAGIILAELRHRMYALDRPGIPAPTPGWWCAKLYCPRLRECEATRAALARVGDAGVPLSTEIRDDAHASALYHRARAAAAAAEQTLSALGEWSKKHPIHVHDDVYFGAVEKKGKESIDANKALPILTHHGIDKAVELRVSKAAIEDLIRDKAMAEGSKIAPLERKILGELREAGAARVGSPYTKIEEYKRKKEDTSSE